MQDSIDPNDIHALLHEDFDEALADELAREWDIERLASENFSPFSGTWLGHIEGEDTIGFNE